MDIENKISFSDFIDRFEELYTEHREIVFVAFEEEGYFSALNDKQKQNLYNTISVFAY